MPHLAEHSAVRGDDTLDRPIGAVRVMLHLHGRVAVEVRVLRDNLSIRRQLGQKRLRCHEAALTMGNRNRIDFARLYACQPRRTIGNNARLHQLGLVTSDAVIGQRRTGFIRIDDLAVRH